MNKILYIILVAMLVACGASKTKVATKKTTRTTQKSVKNQKARSVENTSKPTTETLEATQKIKVTTEMVQAYILRYKEVAKKNMVTDGVPASITLAQGILESGAGTGNLSIQANNHFGIKCHKEWTGESVKHDDDALQECFRKYKHPEESYKDHSYFLTTRTRYASLFTLPKNDYKAWANGLQKAGYATDVKYPEKLISLIERYQLQQYDNEVLGNDAVAKPIDAKSDISTENEYIVVKGDTLYSISKRFAISIDDLKAKNNITNNALSLGQRILIK